MPKQKISSNKRTKQKRILWRLTKSNDSPQQSLVSLEDVFNEIDPTENYAVKILAEIREALGVGSKPMLSDLSEIARRIRQGHERYEKLRTFNPNQFTELWREALYTRNFDELLDKWEPK